MTEGMSFDAVELDLSEMSYRDKITVCWFVCYSVTLFELTVVNNWWIIMVSIVTALPDMRYCMCTKINTNISYVGDIQFSAL